MTFKTTTQNTFKPEHLKGLVYKNEEYPRRNFVKIYLVILALMAIAAALHTCNSKPVQIATTETTYIQ